MARIRSADWWRASYTVQFEEVQNGGYLSEWFDDALDQASATPVVVGDGQAVSGIDAQLDIGGSISGTVTDANGDPVMAVQVIVDGPSSGSASPRRWRTARTRSAGWRRARTK